MTPLASISAVTERISQIQQRFAGMADFATSLATAQASTGSASGSSALARGVSTATSATGAADVPQPIADPSATPAAYAVRLGPQVTTAGTDRAAGPWASRLPADGQRWAGAIEEAATTAGVDPALLGALVWAESAFKADAGSGAGAIGLTQLMPGTARGLGVDPHDPLQNLEGGARYLRAQLDRFGSNSLALAAYNAGPGAVSKYGGIPPYRETQAYVPRVIGYYNQLRGQS